MFAVGSKGNFFKKRLTKEEIRRLRFKHCNELGYEVDECFKLHGIPDLYKRLKENREKYHVNFADNCDDAEYVLGSLDQKNGGVDISKIVQAEISKHMSSLALQNANANQVNADINMVKKGQEDTGCLLDVMLLVFYLV